MTLKTPNNREQLREDDKKGYAQSVAGPCRSKMMDQTAIEPKVENKEIKSYLYKDSDEFRAFLLGKADSIDKGAAFVTHIPILTDIRADKMDEWPIVLRKEEKAKLSDFFNVLG